MLTNETVFIKNAIDEIDKTYSEDEFMHDYQYRIREYIKRRDIRGILLYLGVGSGKSILAASITEFYRMHEPKRKIILLMSKSLQDNFANNIKKYMRNNKTRGNFDKILDENYNFVSLNAGNMYGQISNIDKSEIEIEYEKTLGKLNEHIQSTTFLENTLLVIDEVHNLCVSIKNGSRNAINLYHTIMKTKNIKLIFLTGTPITNTPFELVPLFNLLKGYGNKKYTLFPESQKEFDNLFIHKPENITIYDTDIKDVHIKNKNIFQNRITGLVSYYGEYFFENKKREGFPTQLPLIVERVEMSQTQTLKYLEYRDAEIKEASVSFGKPSTDGFGVKKTEKISSYRIRSRMASNYLIPYYALNAIKDESKYRVKIEKDISKIAKDDLRNLDKFSPKFKKILENIHKRPNQLSVVYSEFVETGINLFALVLEAYNYQYWHKSQYTDDTIAGGFDIDITNSGGAISKSKKKLYALISGNTPFVERNRIIKAFNSKNNISGDIIAVLLISKSSAEGLTLKNVKSIHIMEPFWNYARIEQIIARGSRMNSHNDLPEKDRIIQPYIYISIYPKDYKPVLIGEDHTSDEELLSNSLINKKLITQFNLAMIESSIDCSINKQKLDIPDDRLKCHLCIPNNKKLYTDDILYDIKLNSCTPLTEEEISVEKINIDGVNYFYRKKDDNIKVYEYDANIGKHIEMKKGNPIYAEISKKILFNYV